MTIGADVAALPASGGWVGFYSWDGPEYDANLREIRLAAYARRFVIARFEGAGNGHDAVLLVPQAAAPVRCVAGMRHGGKRSRRRARKLAALTLTALRFRDRLAKEIGWNAAVADPRFRAVLHATSPRWRRR